MGNLFWVAFALLAGAGLPLQGGVNALLGKEARNPVYATLFSFVVGTVALALYIAVTGQTVSWEGIRRAPWYAWIGGLFGAFYVLAVILALPKLGPGLTFGLTVAGLMIVSMALEHFNVLVAQPHPVTLPRLLGILLIVGGVILIRMF